MFLTKRFYLFCIVLILLLGTGYMVTSLLLVAQIGVLALFLAVLFDIWQLYREKFNKWFALLCRTIF